MSPPRVLLRLAKQVVRMTTGKSQSLFPVPASWCKKLQGSVVVLAAGMPRSGSTWLYNAARLLLCSSPEIADDFSCGWVDDLWKLPKKHYMLIKLHGYDQGLIDQANKVLYSYRDIRDSLASSERKFGHAPTIERADAFVQQYDQWTSVADFVMRYETMLSSKETVLNELARALGILGFDAETTASQIDQLTYESEGPKNDSYHEVNLFHRGHRTDGRQGSWISSTKGSEIQLIEERHHEWFEKCGYEITNCNRPDEVLKSA